MNKIKMKLLKLLKIYYKTKELKMKSKICSKVKNLLFNKYYYFI